MPNNGDQARTPLLDALVNYYQNNVSFHMPAHRNGTAAPEDLLGFVGRELFCLDQTEVPGLDDLHNPVDVIAEAQRLAARAFGADRTFFLINGTTGGIHALLAGSCLPGTRIILSRNIHRSVLWGLIISGADPVYIPVRCVAGFGISAPVSPAEFNAACSQNPGASAAMLVNPTYHGLCGQIKEMAGFVHKYDRPLLIDEAHGAHLHFHPELPDDALSAGADAAVQSTHKLGGSLTQASMLHLKGNRVNYEAVAEVLGMVQTTSPSYILMSSLDAARHQMFFRGRELLERTIELACWVREQLKQVTGLSILAPECLESTGLSDCLLDCTKILISAARLGLSGYELSSMLRNKYGIQVEMADLLNVLCMITIGTTRKDCEELVYAVNDIAQRFSRGSRDIELMMLRTKAAESACMIAEKIMNPREAWMSKRRTLPLEEAVGEISAEAVTVYPPGIPALLPGEMITPEVFEYLQLVRDIGIPLQGPRDPRLEKLEVVNG